VLQGRLQKIFQGGGQWKNQDREMAPVSLPLLDQWRIKGETRHTLKGTLHQELRVKSEDLFLENTHFRKNAYLFRKFQAIFVRKNLVLASYLFLITPVSTKRVLVEKHISGIMYENPRGHGPPRPTPMRARKGKASAVRIASLFETARTPTKR